MAIKIFSLLTVLALSGCATFEPIDDMVNIDEQPQDNELAQSIKNDTPLSSSIGFHRQFKQNDTVTEANKMLLQQGNSHLKNHDINHYVRGLMQDLVGNLQYVNATTPVAVVSFVMLDSDYNDANLLGVQIAESLIHEVHKFGIPVIDFKTTGYIRVTEQGDFAFSKDYEDFTGEMPARYIVGGTMLKHIDGYLINARIVGIESQAVVASAQSFIPNSVSDPIMMKSAVPKSQVLNNNVELSSIEYPQGFDSALNKKNVDNMHNVDNNTSSNSVYLIQE
jgi:TolB-like protein